MGTNQVRTQTKDTLLVDEIRVNLVDGQLTQNRKRLLWFLLLAVFLVVIFGVI